MSLKREQRESLFAGGCPLEPAPDREDSIHRIFIQAATKKDGDLDLGKGINTLLERIACQPEKDRDLEYDAAARVIRAVCPNSPIRELIQRVFAEVDRLIARLPELGAVAPIVATALAAALSFMSS